MILKGVTGRRVRTVKGYQGSNDPFYQSRQWKETRKHFLKANPLCVICQSEGKVKEAVVVDHIQPRNQGGDSHSWSNLQGLCKHHNAIKTALDNPNNQY